METNEKNLRKYIKSEYERITNENGFAYGYLDRDETYAQLTCLLRMVREFYLGEDLERDITDTQRRLRKHFISVKCYGWQKYDAIEKMLNN